jgi:hypothetical protein
MGRVAKQTGLHIHTARIFSYYAWSVIGQEGKGLGKTMELSRRIPDD